MVESSAPKRQTSSVFITPIQFISQLLIDLKQKYFRDESTESAQVRAHLDYSLEHLKNKHSLFTIDTDLKLPSYSQP